MRPRSRVAAVNQMDEAMVDYSFRLSEEELQTHVGNGCGGPNRLQVCSACKVINEPEADRCRNCGYALRLPRRQAQHDSPSGHGMASHPRPAPASPHAQPRACDRIGALYPYSILSNRKTWPDAERPADRLDTTVPLSGRSMALQPPAMDDSGPPVLQTVLQPLGFRLTQQRSALLLVVAGGVIAASYIFSSFLFEPGPPTSVAAGSAQKRMAGKERYPLSAVLSVNSSAEPAGERTRTVPAVRQQADRSATARVEDTADTASSAPQCSGAQLALGLCSADAK